MNLSPKELGAYKGELPHDNSKSCEHIVSSDGALHHLKARIIKGNLHMKLLFIKDYAPQIWRYKCRAPT